MNVTQISPPKFWQGIDPKELWQFRELLYFFAWRDLKVRYKQTSIGVAWAIFQPVLTMIVFTIFFGNLAKIPSDGVPYPIFVYTGLLFWNLFVNTLSGISDSLISNQSIVTKVYFPRILLPFSFVITNLVDFFISSIVLLVLMFYYGFHPGIAGLIMIFPLIFITCISSVGLGLILASINIKYRDVRYIIPFFIQLLLFVTPVIYPASVLKEYTILFALNPMAGVISTARAALLGVSEISWLSLGFSAIVGCLFFIAGVFVFKRAEAFFADVI